MLTAKRELSSYRREIAMSKKKRPSKKTTIVIFESKEETFLFSLRDTQAAEVEPKINDALKNGCRSFTVMALFAPFGAEDAKTKEDEFQFSIDSDSLQDFWSYYFDAARRWRRSTAKELGLD